MKRAMITVIFLCAASAAKAGVIGDLKAVSGISDAVTVPLPEIEIANLPENEGPAEQFLIERGYGVGNLKFGMTLDQVQGIYGKGRVKVKNHNDDGEYQTWEIYLPGKNEAALICELENNNTAVRAIEVYDPGYVIAGTRIGVGSPTSLVKKEFENMVIQGQAGRVLATADDITFHFYSAPATAGESIADNAPVKFMIIEKQYL